jgi:maltose-binding protein MalE
MFLRISLYALLLFTVVSCKRESVNNNNTEALSGTWRINYYWDQKDETSNFSSYNFMFNSGGQLMAHANSGAVVTGTWSETSTKFTINFGSDPVLSDLNSEWLKTERTGTVIKLKDDNPSQDDQLHFIKN